MTLHELTVRLREEGRKQLVPYLTAGFPDVATSGKLLRAVRDAGCEIVEIGVPFSDPVADGPVIQAASQRALAAGMTLRGALDLAAAATDLGLLPVVMTYLNPVLSLGPERFAALAADAGVGGVILPDVPLEESAPLRGALGAAGLDLVDLVAPTSGEARLERIGRQARGFLYVVSHTGVTGGRTDPGRELRELLAALRRHTTTPCYVGFGISDPERAAAVAAIADGVIVGSALLRTVDAAPAGGEVDAALTFLASLQAAVTAAAGKETT